MTALHKMISLVIRWIASGGVLAIFLMNATLYNLDKAIIVIVFILAFAVSANHFITRAAVEAPIKIQPFI